ncbi:hypothetical protein M199_gp167 [Halogranum tailed virus 1]|uniref:Uncharacterized protein n=1 Tax=Halogranum tailed virus 1 TaxID=1273749 RepID=R4T706_9CAUD|nr:hypothetical protein M199_gp167 [Halogranum tailed virus 1]AGM11499.1 hypothetical protein HGTV1_202 [Halogranum tailed virus 1]
MPAKCKYCGYEMSIWTLIWERIKSGAIPVCPGCEANDETVEVRIE